MTKKTGFEPKGLSCQHLPHKWILTQSDSGEKCEESTKGLNIYDHVEFMRTF